MQGSGRDVAPERRLVAIVAMDVVGYSRLMGADEVGTLNALKSHRAELIDPAVAAHHGRVVKTTGDGFLLEFASVVDAIGCAVAIQRGMLTRNTSIRDDRRLVFRVGVNIGDIIIDGSDIFGDGVNVAARLETICEPGGICISRAANEQIRDKLSLSFADLGEHTVKNITRAVGVYGLAAKDIANLPETPLAQMQPGVIGGSSAERVRRPLLLAGVALILLVAAIGSWSLLSKRPVSIEKQLAAALARSIPAASEKYRSETLAGYLKLGPQRAIAVAPRTSGTWRTGLWPSREIAEEKALEKCQLFYDEPCAVLASGDAVAPSGGDGSWPIRDAQRVRYAGAFNPERVPAVRPADLERVNASGYLATPGPKAMAIHASGALHVALGGANQRVAEEQALRACNADPARREPGGPCYLYAAEGRVVLPLRATVPLAATPPAPAVVSPPQTPAPLRAVLLDALSKLVPNLPSTTRDGVIDRYLAARGSKALAARPGVGTWQSTNWATPAVAEERMLEQCQVRYGGPCAVVALDDKLVGAGANGERPLRAMPRASYAGVFSIDRIPGINDVVRNRADVAGYAAQPDPKAAAYHPWGRLFIVMGAPSQRAAEERALAACNNDPDRNGQAGPCLLYAVSNHVVLARQQTGPITAAQ